MAAIAHGQLLAVRQFDHHAPDAFVVERLAGIAAHHVVLDEDRLRLLRLRRGGERGLGESEQEQQAGQGFHRARVSRGASLSA
ncbi:MAG TPA: hypothetical protein VGN55_07830 [Xanthobacteraceae bacterium]|jgi:hypothetical protein